MPVKSRSVQTFMADYKTVFALLKRTIEMDDEPISFYSASRVVR